MRLQALTYIVGTMLVIFGSLRAFLMGWQRRDREIRDEEEGGPRRKGPRYHLMWGILWVLMGVALVVSTYLQSRR